MLRVLAALFVLGWCPYAIALDPALDASQYGHTAWFLREGFARGQIYAIAQTPDGYLWLGTDFGLLRFDGVRTVPWQPPGNEQLPNSWIRTLFTAPNGTLWIGTLGGLASWKDGRLTGYPNLAGHSIQSILSDREGTIWVGAYGPTARLCAVRNGRAQCDAGGFGDWVESLYEDRDGALWATAQTGLWRWRPDAPEHQPIPDVAIASSQALNEDENGRLLIAAEGGIIQLVDGKAVEYPVPAVRSGFQPQRLLRDRDGGLWIGTADRGLLHVHGGRTDAYTQADGLSGDFVTRLFEDREGNLWVATKSGLDRFRNVAVQTISSNQGLPTAPWSVLAARDGSIWLGSLNGLSRWKDGQVTTYRTTNSGSAGGTQPGAASEDAREVFDSGLPDDGVGTLFEDGDGRLWVTTLRGVAYFDRGRFVPVRDLPQGRTPLIAGDGAGNVWIVNGALGLYRVRDNAVVERIPWTALNVKDAPTTLLPDPSQGGLWLGFQDATVAYVKDGQIRASYTPADGLAEGRVNDVRAGKDGALWVAMGGGLSQLKDGRVVALNSRNGLPCDAVNWSMEDDDHSVWLYTVCGLVRIASTELEAAVSDPTRRIQTTVFDSSDGVAVRSLPPIYRPQVTRTADGSLWFVPGDSASILDPRRLALNALPPSVQIEQVTADRTTYDAATGLRLPPLVRDLEVDYTALSLVAPEKNRFRVKLEGRDLDWQDVGNRRQAFYADLAPGTYRFRVTASNNDGVWNEAGARLDFSIAPAYYQTTWFRAASIVMVLALFWALYQFHLRQITHDFSLRLDERVNERTRIARDLHDTLLQSFQGVMLRFQSARDLLPAHPARAAKALDGALERADQAIVEGRDAIQSLRSSASASDELVQVITMLGEELTENGEKGAAMFSISVEGSPRDLHPIVRDDIHHVAREALRNAFRHAEAEHIEAEVTYGARVVRVRIRDDGKGIDPERLSAGRAGHWGLTNMRERAAQIGAELRLWSEVGAGTEVELRIPGAVAYDAPGRRGRQFCLGRKQKSRS